MGGGGWLGATRGVDPVSEVGELKLANRARVSAEQKLKPEEAS